jgi:hypothetical protein
MQRTSSMRSTLLPRKLPLMYIEVWSGWIQHPSSLDTFLSLPEGCALPFAHIHKFFELEFASYNMNL